jgi:release factor glutamine methyltransferase
MNNPTTVGDWIAAAAQRLTSVERPRAEARALLASALGEDSSRLFAYPERIIPTDIAQDQLNRRLSGEPLSRILGVREFWSLDFRLAPDVLDPRPDTEIVVEATLKLLENLGQPHLLDLGTGSGCILLALLSERQDATGHGVDRAAGAIEIACQNAKDHGIATRTTFSIGDWGSALPSAAFDFIVSNPPYIARRDGPAPDEPTRKHDPDLALWGGDDGLAAYRVILPDIPRLLRLGGKAAVEIGAAQSVAVTEIAEVNGLSVIGQHSDLAGHIRCLILEPTGDRQEA